MEKSCKLYDNKDNTINITLGRYCELNELEEIKELKPGLDFRKPEYRREVFFNFYEFHLKYKSHPGGVYYLFPYLAKKYNFDTEQKLWFAYINGCTQNPLTTWVLFNQFPDFKNITFDKLEKWHRKYWKYLDYDIDRRYQKGHFVEMAMNYKEIVGDKTQEEFFMELCNTDNVFKNFDNVWDKIINKFFMYGRLSTFSYTEYLKIMGLPIECSNLFIFDKSGSKSHRNGLCIVNGRDDLDWRKDNEFIQKELKGHNKDIMKWIEFEGEQLLNEAKERFKGRDFYEDVNYFTLESTLCCYKSWHRKNRRYPGVYNDMMYDRIKKAESIGWDKILGNNINFNDFWDARKEYLPKYMRMEDNPDDPGLDKVKQNWYRNTGQVIIMDNEFDHFKNDFNTKENFNRDKIIEKSLEWYGKPPKRYSSKKEGNLNKSIF